MSAGSEDPWALPASRGKATRRVAAGGGANDILPQLIDLAKAAQDRLFIVVPWWDDREPLVRPFTDAVVEAHARGVTVKVILRPHRDCESTIGRLRRAGVEVVAARHEHRKELIADGRLLHHSMNLASKEVRVNTQSGLVIADRDTVERAAAAFLASWEDAASGRASEGQERRTPTAQVVPPQMAGLLQHPELNPLQAKAVPVVLDSRGHVMVVAPTGAGKTVIGEVAVLRAVLLDKQKAAWLVPARALAGEIGQLRQRWAPHGIKVVELTGEANLDSPALAEAHVWVTTTEKFESLMRRATLREAQGQLGCVVVDEVHLVGDPGRGPTLEGVLARLRQLHDRTRIVALSATAANAEQLAEWLNAHLVTSSWRPTRLTAQVVPYFPDGPSYSDQERAKDRALVPLVQEFTNGDADDGQGSVVVFCGARKAAVRVAALLADVEGGGDEEAVLHRCLEAGVGFHYRGSPRAELVLQGFRDRRLKVLVATSGLTRGFHGRP